jgi:hypothetical protein
MKRIKMSSVLLFLLVAVTSYSQPTSTAERRFKLPEGGHFGITVPSDWKDLVEQSSNRLPSTIIFGAGSGRPFQLLITPIRQMAKDSGPQLKSRLRSTVEQAAEHAKSQSVEREIPIKEFQGRAGTGYYFSATDRAPKPGEYKFLTQGILLLGELNVTFTILTNEGQESVVRQALDSLKNAVQNDG